MIGLETQLNQTTFFSRVNAMKRTQNSWMEAYINANQIANSIKQKGEPVNIIYNSSSWLSPKRHLHRIRYDRLIEYDPETDTYLVVDGINKDTAYIPRSGDIILNIDRKISDLRPLLSTKSNHQLYRHNESDKSGAIFRLKSSKVNNPGVN